MEPPTLMEALCGRVIRVAESNARGLKDMEVRLRDLSESGTLAELRGQAAADSWAGLAGSTGVQKLTAALAELRGQVAAEHEERSGVGKSGQEEHAALTDMPPEELADVLSAVDVVRSDLRRSTEEWEASMRGLEQRLQELSQNMPDAHVSPTGSPEVERLTAALADLREQVAAERASRFDEVSRARMAAEHAAAHAEMLALSLEEMMNTGPPSGPSPPMSVPEDRAQMSIPED